MYSWAVWRALLPFHPSTVEAEAGGQPSVRCQPGTTEGVPGQPGLEQDPASEAPPPWSARSSWEQKGRRISTLPPDLSLDFQKAAEATEGLAARKALKGP